MPKGYPTKLYPQIYGGEEPRRYPGCHYAPCTKPYVWILRRADCKYELQFCQEHLLLFDERVRNALVAVDELMQPIHDGEGETK